MSKLNPVRILDWLPWIGVVTAAATAIVNKILGSDWAVVLAATSLTAMWIALIHYMNTAKRYHECAATIFEDMARPSSEAEVPLLLAMRFAFLNTQVDAEFWACYCCRVLEQVRKNCDATSILRRTKELKEAMEKQQVIAEADYAYHLMADLFRIVTERGRPYKGIFTKADLEPHHIRTDIDELVFDLPLRSKGRVERLFLLTVSDLQSLSKDQREKLLKQLKDPRIELRRLDPAGVVLNVGIYGGTAVGELDPVRNVNVFDFDRNAVAEKEKEFHQLWQRAGPKSLKAEHLQAAEDALNAGIVR